MNTFTKTLIASALAVAVTGPAIADVNEDGAYEGAKTTVKINPNGCKNDKFKNVQTTLGFYEWDPGTGYWAAEFSLFEIDELLEGTYVERKVGKDLTIGLDEESLYGGVGIPEDPNFSVGEWIDSYVSSTACGGGMTEGQFYGLRVTKGKIKISKNGEKAKLDMKVEGEYTTDKDKVKKVNATIKTSNMDFNSAASNPAD